MLDTIIFDMGGTIEDIWYNADTEQAVTVAIMRLLAQEGIRMDVDEPEFWKVLQNGVKTYKRWSMETMLEKKPEEIWPEYYLRDFGFPREQIARIAETLAQTWETVHYHRELRPQVRETLETLRLRGYKLGVLSNTASLYSVFQVLENYGIREYFEDVTLSSITGYRKPHPGIFEISTRQLRSSPENCMYVGDTVSRDIVGARRAGFGQVVQISSFMTKVSDTDVEYSEYAADHVMSGDFIQLVDYIDEAGILIRP